MIVTLRARSDADRRPTGAGKGRGDGREDGRLMSPLLCEGGNYDDKLNDARARARRRRIEDDFETPFLSVTVTICIWRPNPRLQLNLAPRASIACKTAVAP